MSGKIFINYRRGEDSGFVHALMSPLEQAFSAERLFIDIDSIEPGVDFVRVLDEQVAKCDILLAVIGKGWLEARDETNQRRLDNPDDFVRIEIEAALNHGKRVIPVLVGDARMPRSDELPDALRPLAKRGGVRLTHERFRADTADFINKLKKSLDGIEHERGNEASGNFARGSLAQTLRLIVPSRQGTAPRRWLMFTIVGLAVIGVETMDRQRTSGGNREVAEPKIHLAGMLAVPEILTGLIGHLVAIPLRPDHGPFSDRCTWNPLIKRPALG